MSSSAQRSEAPLFFVKPSRAAPDGSGEDVLPYVVRGDFPKTHERGRSRLHIFDVGRDVPLVAEGVGYAAAAIAVGMILRRGD
jgi:hypothetical protein